MHQAPYKKNPVVMGSVRRSVKPGASCRTIMHDSNDKMHLLGRESRACQLGRCDNRRKEVRSCTWSLSL